MLSTIQGAAYIERVSVHDVKNVKNAYRAIKKAFQMQIDNKGFSLVEVLSTCPVNWKMSPADALKGVREMMIPEFPLGVKKDII